MEIPEQHKRTIRRLVSRNKAVAQATCDIPHTIPGIWLRKRREETNDLPYCGCFIGVYAWMQECALGKEVFPSNHDIPKVVADHTGISEASIDAFGGWCSTHPRDRFAVNYALEILASA